MKKRKGYALLLALALLLTGCSRAEMQSAQAGGIALADTSSMDFSFTDRELSGDYDAANATRITGVEGRIVIEGRGASLSGTGISIVDEGCYILSGTIGDCMLSVVVPEDEKVQIVLAGAEIRNTAGPAIYIRSADKVFLTLAKGTENIVSDGADYALSEDGSSVDGAVFSWADLCFNGGGSLRLSGNYKHGVVSKDDLVVANCRLDVTAKKQGLSGKDCVKICSTEMQVESGADGIQSDNDEDADRGYIYLENSSLKIAAENDGIQAETVLRAVDSNLEILSGGGSSQSLSGSENSCKGLKAGQDILLEGGRASIDSRDDCIHANGNVAVYAGEFMLSSGDDGLHADAGLLFEGGRMEILKSYEGIEGSEIRVSGGEMRITASDDGMNLAGGSDGSAVGDRPGRGMFDVEDGCIEISGGRLWVNALGDGIDSNGSLRISGGVTLVSGPTGSGNAALDHNGATVTGGTLIAVGSAGMALGFSAAENQGAMLVNFDFQAAGTPLVLCNGVDGVVAAFTPGKDYQSAVITAPGVQAGETYRLLAGAVAAEADADGFAASGTAAGGTELMRLEMDSNLYGGSFGGHGFGGGMRGNEGRRREMPESFSGNMIPPDTSAMPGNMPPPEGMKLPEGIHLPGEGAPERPWGEFPGGWKGNSDAE